MALAALVALATVTGGTPQAESRARPARRRPRRPAPRPAGRRMTATRTEAPASPPMRGREFGELAGDVAAACGRYGVPAWSEEDRERLEAALWRFIHPDLAHSPADPYHDPDEN